MRNILKLPTFKPETRSHPSRKKPLYTLFVASLRVLSVLGLSLAFLFSLASPVRANTTPPDNNPVDYCLHGIATAPYAPTIQNRTTIVVIITNNCGDDVTNVTADLSEINNCPKPAIGDPNATVILRAGSIAKGQTVDINDYVEAYCILCVKHKAVAWPEFTVTVSLDEVEGEVGVGLYKVITRNDSVPTAFSVPIINGPSAEDASCLAAP